MIQWYVLLGEQKKGGHWPPFLYLNFKLSNFSN